MEQHATQATIEVKHLRDELNRQLEINRLAREQIKPALELLCEVQRENGRLSAELEHLQVENGRLKEVIDRREGDGIDRQHPINLTDDSETVRSLKEQLACLQQQYDNLFQEKEQASRRYQEHYRKWRNFKKWLANEQSARLSDFVDPLGTPSTARLQKIQRVVHPSSPNSNDDNDEDMLTHEPIPTTLRASPMRNSLPLQDVSLQHNPIPSLLGRSRVLSEPTSPTISQTKHPIKDSYKADCKHPQDDITITYPAKLTAPLWRTPRKKTRKESETIQQYMPTISNHQIAEEMPQTPPGYWNIGFPDTQEIELINRQGQQLYHK
ncbi:hypothetical protein QCA50_007889 [Cerrena zonata]|uniref:DNA endonuclease activator Ctp1 C-terminal domain-containing protein n=1 Tax=Cerrena zonata TaxID=2478898 RepID=A0AAW0G6B3_9APHY